MTASSFCPIKIQKRTLMFALVSDHVDICEFNQFFGFLNNKHDETKASLPDQYSTCVGKRVQGPKIHLKKITHW